MMIKRKIYTVYVCEIKVQRNGDEMKYYLCNVFRIEDSNYRE